MKKGLIKIVTGALLLITGLQISTTTVYAETSNKNEYKANATVNLSQDDLQVLRGGIEKSIDITEKIIGGKYMDLVNEGIGTALNIIFGKKQKSGEEDYVASALSKISNDVAEIKSLLSSNSSEKTISSYLNYIDALTNPMETYITELSNKQKDLNDGEVSQSEYNESLRKFSHDLYSRKCTLDTAVRVNYAEEFMDLVKKITQNDFFVNSKKDIFAGYDNYILSDCRNIYRWEHRTYEIRENFRKYVLTNLQKLYTYVVLALRGKIEYELEKGERDKADAAIACLTNITGYRIKYEQDMSLETLKTVDLKKNDCSRQLLSNWLNKDGNSTLVKRNDDKRICLLDGCTDIKLSTVAYEKTPHHSDKHSDLYCYAIQNSKDFTRFNVTKDMYMTNNISAISEGTVNKLIKAYKAIGGEYSNCNNIFYILFNSNEAAINTGVDYKGSTSRGEGEGTSKLDYASISKKDLYLLTNDMKMNFHSGSAFKHSNVDVYNKGYKYESDNKQSNCKFDYKQIFSSKTDIKSHKEYSFGGEATIIDAYYTTSDGTPKLGNKYIWVGQY